MERRLKHLLESVDVLKEYQGLSLEELAESPKVYWAVQHGLQLCVQAIVDIAAHLVAALGSPLPDDYRGYIVALGKLGALSRQFADRIAALAGFRNILVHEYLDVDLAEVRRVLNQNLGDFEEFAAHVYAYLTQVNPKYDP